MGENTAEVFVERFGQKKLLENDSGEKREYIVYEKAAVRMGWKVSFLFGSVSVVGEDEMESDADDDDGGVNKPVKEWIDIEEKWEHR